MKEFLVTDKRASGLLQQIKQQETHRLRFIDFSDSLEISSRVRDFIDEQSFVNYLSTRMDVNTWQIKNERIGSYVYYHREPFGEIEYFSSELQLNYSLAMEGRGAWFVKHIGQWLPPRKNIYLLDTSNWWKSAYTVFDNKMQFQEAYQRLEEERLSRHKKWAIIFMVSSVTSSCYSLYEKLSASLTSTVENNKVDNSSNEKLDTALDRSLKLNEPQWLDMTKIVPTALAYGFGYAVPNKQNLFNGLRSLVTLTIFNTMLGNPVQAVSNSDETTFSNVLELNGNPVNLASSGVTVDSNGNVFVLGNVETRNRLNRSGILTIWSSQGSLLQASTLSIRGIQGVATPDIALATDNTLVITGSMGSITVPTKAIIFKLTKNGDPIWAYLLDGPNSSYSYASMVTSSPDKTIVLAGDRLDGSMFSAKVTNDGNLLWSNKFSAGSPDDYIYHPSAISSMSDGGVVLTWAVSNSSPANLRRQNVYIARLDTDGFLLWLKTINDGIFITIHSLGINMFDNGSLLVVGSTGTLSSSNRYCWLAKLDSAEGRLIWSKRINDSNFFFPGEAGISSDGIVVTGTFYYPYDTNSTKSLFIMKWSSDNGIIEWIGELQLPYGEGYSLNPCLTVNIPQNDSITTCNILARSVLENKIIITKVTSKGSLSLPCDYYKPKPGLITYQENALNITNATPIVFDFLHLTLVNNLPLINIEDVTSACKASSVCSYPQPSHDSLLLGLLITGGILTAIGVVGAIIYYRRKQKETGLSHGIDRSVYQRLSEEPKPKETMKIKSYPSHRPTATSSQSTKLVSNEENWKILLAQLKNKAPEFFTYQLDIQSSTDGNEVTINPSLIDGTTSRLINTQQSDSIIKRWANALGLLFLNEIEDLDVFNGSIHVTAKTSSHAKKFVSFVNYITSSFERTSQASLNL
jgi:hypothetical protein